MLNSKVIVVIIVVIVVIIGIGSLSIGENFSKTSEIMPEQSSGGVSEEPKGRNLSVNLEETMSFSTPP